MRKVDLDFIKKNEKRQYLWETGVGHIANFEFDNIKDQFYIKDFYVNKNRAPYYIVEYNHNIFHIRVYELRDASIKKIIKNNIDCHNWDYNIGDNIKDNKRDLIITNKKYGDYISSTNKKYGQKIGKLKKQYQYKCNICGFDATGTDYWIRERDLRNGFGCTCCRGITTVKGINDFGSKHPDLIKYFVDENDAYIYPEFSSEYIKMKCPICGFQKDMKLADLSNHGFYCPKCSDGISYPEKLMMSVLDQLGIDYIFQLSGKDFSWIHDYLYDFYIKDKNSIIETHGLQHYKKDKDTSSFIPYEEQVKRDNDKYSLAKPYIDNYIVIDCRFSELEYIKNNIYQSKLNDWYDLSIIDWKKAEKFCNTSLVNEICVYYNSISNKHPSEIFKLIIEKFNISLSTIKDYLERGSKSGLCNYKKLTLQDSTKISNRLGSRPLSIIYNDTKIYFSKKMLLHEWMRNNNIPFSIKTLNSKINTDEKYHDLLIYSCTKQQFNDMYDNPDIQTFGEKFHEYYVQKELEDIKQNN